MNIFVTRGASPGQRVERPARKRSCIRPPVTRIGVQVQVQQQTESFYEDGLVTIAISSSRLLVLPSNRINLREAGLEARAVSHVLPSMVSTEA
jgi:hypothetical protein